MPTNPRQLTKQIVLVVVASCLSLLLVVAVEAWTGPTGAPPNTNTATPVNLGASQTKAGSLGVTSLVASSICFGADCRTSWSGATSGATRVYCSSSDGSAAASWNEVAAFWNEAQTLSGGQVSASCPAGKSLVYHSVTYFYNYGNDWSYNQNEQFYVKGNYSANSITCQIPQSNPDPAHLGGMGLCM